MKKHFERWANRELTSLVHTFGVTLKRIVDQQEQLDAIEKGLDNLEMRVSNVEQKVQKKVNKRGK